LLEAIVSLPLTNTFGKLHLFKANCNDRKLNSGESKTMTPSCDGMALCYLWG